MASIVEIPSSGGSSFGAIRRARRELRTASRISRSTSRGSGSRPDGRFLSGAKRRIGFDRAARREPGSAILLTERRALPDIRSPRHRQEPRAPRGDRPLRRRAARLPAAAARARASPDRPASSASSRRERPVLLHPGGGWSSKLWPAERYGELAARLGARGIPAARLAGGRAKRSSPVASSSSRKAPRGSRRRPRSSSSRRSPG